MWTPWKPEATAGPHEGPPPNAEAPSGGAADAGAGGRVPPPPGAAETAPTADAEDVRDAPERMTEDRLRELWGRLPGVDADALDFGPAGRQATALAGLAAPLRRLWPSDASMRCGAPLNLLPDTARILTRPHDAADRGWPLRILDTVDWYLTHPTSRHARYHMVRRARRHSLLRWHLHRLRATLRGRAPGPPPWLLEPGDPPPSVPQDGDPATPERG